MDLSSYTLPELRRLLTKIESEIHRRSESTRGTALEQVQKMAVEQDLTLSDLSEASAAPTETKAAITMDNAATAAKKVKVPSVIKYRNPANPEQGWSGHGRRPQWVLDWLAQGKLITDLAV